MTKSFITNDLNMVILAGGQSRRMGRDKSRLPWNHTHLLGHMREIATTTGHPVRVIRKDLQPGIGPIGGIWTAFQRHKAPAFVFLPCDMPLLTGQLLRRFVRQFRSQSQDGALITWHTGKWGFPLGLTRDALEAVASVMASTNPSIQNLAARVKARRFVASPHEASHLGNVNTPRDLARLRGRRRK